jgi:CDP-glycerol glycerophosphotransferase (TagB/SpsB family)
VVFANHGAAQRYPPQVPKLRIQHALSAGKRIFGTMVRYAPRLVLRGRRSLYDMLFEASEERRTRVEAAMPALGGKIRLVGDLRADALLAARRERERIRSQLGYDAGQHVVVLCSTWGAGSLVEQMGQALAGEAEVLSGRSRYRFLLSVHPHAWLDPNVAAWLRDTPSDGVRVLGSGEGWERGFVAADALVVDHSSLLAMFALLSKPIVCVPAPADVLDPDSILGRLHALAPALSAPADLADVLELAITTFDPEALRALSRSIDTCPGEAERRMREATYELLALASP